jgi:hypothetical protein
MEWITSLEKYFVDLQDIYFLFHGLKITKNKTLPEKTCISCQQFKTAVPKIGLLQ